MAEARKTSTISLQRMRSTGDKTRMHGSAVDILDLTSYTANNRQFHQRSTETAETALGKRQGETKPLVEDTDAAGTTVLCAFDSEMRGSKVGVPTHSASARGASRELEAEAVDFGSGTKITKTWREHRGRSSEDEQR